MSTGNSPVAYSSLTPRLMVQLAAPHTWPAAIMPCLFAYAAAAAYLPSVSIVTTMVLLCICILMQASVNTFNDYYDYIKGADSKDDDVDPTDAVLVYNNVNPKNVLLFAISLLVIAFALGAYIIYQAGIIPLIIGIIGAVIVVLYSAGKTPISYLPIGECVSGIVMGGLIPLACYQALTLQLNFLVILWAVPFIIGIGLIMMTNNTCDIEKDRLSHRKTLPTLLDRPKARSLYHGLIITWFACIVIIIALWFTSGWPVCVFMLLAGYPIALALWRNPLNNQTRIAAMGSITSLNVVLGAFYAAAIFASMV